MKNAGNCSIFSNTFYYLVINSELDDLKITFKGLNRIGSDDNLPSTKVIEKSSTILIDKTYTSVNLDDTLAYGYNNFNEIELTLGYDPGNQGFKTWVKRIKTEDIIGVDLHEIFISFDKYHNGATVTLNVNSERDTIRIQSLSLGDFSLKIIGIE